MYKKIIILMNDDAEPTERFLDDLLGYSSLEKIGYTVIVYCLNMQREIKQFSKIYNIQFLKSNKELELNLKKHNSQDTLIMSILIFDFFSYNTYRVVSKSGLAYCAYLLNSWAAELEDSGFRALRYHVSIPNIIKTIKTFKKISHIRRLVYDIFPHLPKSLLKIKAPDYILCAGADSLKYFFWYPVGKNTKTIWGHYYDYDKYLALRKEPSKENNRQIVFIDQKLAEDPTIINQNTSINKQLYYLSLDNFFNFIEAKYDVEIVVAAHPNASINYYSDCFQDRKIIYGSTATAIMNSKATILHSSGSRSFVALFRRPTIFIINNEAKKNEEFYKYTLYSANFFNKKLINIDNTADIESFDLDSEMLIDEQCYAYYIEKYIKKNGSLEMPVWEIFHREINAIKRENDAKK